MKTDHGFRRVPLICVCIWLITVCEKQAKAAAGFIGPSPYLSFTNSAFDTGGFTYFYLETLEDNALNTPGLTINSGWLIGRPGPLIDSVDGDDGIIDGFGTNGNSMFSTGSQSNLTLTFNAATLGGHLPTHAGIVCTDIGNVLSGQSGVSDVTFSARDADGVLLGSIIATNFGNAAVQGGTAEDRFFGVINPGGISSVSLTAATSYDWEVDHLQFGYSSPPFRIQQIGPDTVFVAWSTNAVGFSLQQNSALTTTNWNAVTNVPVVVGNEYRVTVTPLSSNRFYRLAAP